MTRKIANRRRTLQPEPALPLDTDLFCAGDRVCIAVSGGADSIALFRALLDQREELGIVVSVLHVNHGLRGEAAKEDAEFVANLAKRFGLACKTVVVDTAKRAKERSETIEEAARNLRYEVFRGVLNCGFADKVATAHTFDDQAETVLMKLLRGAWTEGMSGIYPKLRLRDSTRAMPNAAADCVRPLLSVRRAEIETYLGSLRQPWREDASNRSLTHTRNRVRHELLPLLRQYNPQIDGILGQMAANAQAEEQHWQAELANVLPQILLPGKPVRGGGRSVHAQPGCASVAVDLARFSALDSGLQRRVLRVAANECGITLDFASTERLLKMASSRQRGGEKRSAKRLMLVDGVRVERSARELQFQRRSVAVPLHGKSSGLTDPYQNVVPEIYELSVPGILKIPDLGAEFTVELAESADTIGDSPKLQIRAWQPGDRVELRHSRGAKKVKEILERMRLSEEEKERWPVAVWKGRIVWMRGVDVSQMPLGSGENNSNHGKSCIFLIQEARIDLKGSQEGKFSGSGRLGVE